MMLIRTVRKPSSIHGFGLFADEPIPEGSPTWRFIPGIDQAIHPDIVRRVPEASREAFLTYAYLDIRTGLYVLCADDARFMNHSDTPNVRGEYELDSVFGVDVAARDIEPGEELTCDYRTFDRIDREALHFEVAGRTGESNPMVSDLPGSVSDGRGNRKHE